MSDIVIIGGGVIGLTTARELAIAGLRITLVERDALGREASWAGGGILFTVEFWKEPAPVLALADAGRRIHIEQAARLLADTGIDPERIDCGLLLLDPPQAALESPHRAEFAPDAVVLGPEALRRSEPRLTSSVGSALALPSVAQVRNPRLLQALAADCRRLGVRMVEHTTGVTLIRHGSRITALATPAEDIHGAEFIIAAGAWSEALLQPLGLSADVFPVKGQMLLYRAPPDSLHQIVIREGHYLIPRRDGHILAGSTVEHAGFDKTPSPEARQRLAGAAGALLPMLGHAEPLRHWAGLRPGSPAGIPCIGRVPGIDNLSLNTGHFRNGLVMAPAAARLLADLILNRPPLIDPAPYAYTAPRGRTSVPT